MKNIKKKRKITIAERFYYLSDFLFEIIKNSFFFWIFWLKGFGVASLIASIEALSLVSKDIYEKERKKTFQNFKNRYHNTFPKMFLSLGITILFLFGIYLLIIPLSSFHSDIFVIFYFFFFITILLIIMMLITKEILFSNLKWNFALHVYFLGKRFIWSLAYLLIIFIIIYFSLLNLIFLIGFAPGLIGYFGAVFSKRITNLLDT